MSLVFHVPEPPLNRYIICFWHAELQVPYTREKILPTGTVELIINFGAPFKLVDKQDAKRFTLQDQSWLVGLQTEYLINEPLAETHMIGVRFRPGGAHGFFHCPAHQMHNQVLPMDALWGHFIEEARTRLYEASNLSSKFALLEHLLRSRLSVEKSGQGLINFAIKQLVNSQGAISIATLCDKLAISQKHLSQQFKKFVGVPPKSLARIFRFQHVLNTIDPTQSPNWVDIAHQCHFYDQSHFNRDFLAFTGLSPGEYLSQRRAIFGSALQQGEDIHFVPIG